MFIRHSHWLTIPSSLAPRQNDVICLNLHSRFGLFLSERVLCQSSFAQRDYSQCTYSQTTANGIAGVINELNHSYTITYAAHVSHVKVEVDFDKVILQDNEEDGTLTGEVKFILYKGDHYHLTVWSDWDENVFVDTNDVWDDGDRVGITIPPDAIRVIKITD